MQRMKPKEIDSYPVRVRELVQRLDAVHARQAAELEKIDKRLRDDARREDERRIRQRYGADIDGLLAKLDAIAGELAEQREFYGEAAVRARARFVPPRGEHGSDERLQSDLADATIATATVLRLQGAPVDELVAVAREARTAGGNLALAGAVYRETQRRGLPPDELRPVLTELQRVPLPADDVKASQAIGEALREVNLARVRTREAQTGQTDPFARMAAARGGEARVSSMALGESPADRLTAARRAEVQA